MKKLLLGSMALAAVIAGPVMAADMPVKAPAPVVSYYDWTGVYIGASIGGVWSHVDRTYPLPSVLGASTFSSSGTDTIWDIHLGAQQQWGWFVLGVEAGYSAGFKEMQQTTGVLPNPLSNPPFGLGCGFVGCLGYSKITNLLTIGARLGIAWDRWMFYGTGGYANGKIKGTYACANNGALTLPGPACFPFGAAGTLNDSGDSSNDGWYAGGGFEYMIYKGPLVDAIVGGEYQHFDLSAKRGCCANQDPFVFDQSARGDIVRARLTIKTQGWKFIAP